MTTNALLSPSVITKETLVILENNLVMAGKVNRQFENQFHKIGTTLTVRKPNRFLCTNGPGLSLQNITEPSTSITINNQLQVSFQFNSVDLTLVIEEFSERYCKPAAVEMANLVDYLVYGNYNQVYNLVGTAGTVPSTFTSITLVGKRMDKMAVPQDGRTLVLSPNSYWGILPNLVSNLLVPSVAEPALKGFLANLANFEIYLDQNAQAQTVGNFGGTPVVNGANQTGSAIVTNGWTASVTGLLNIGDVITFAGVYSVNPKSRVSTGELAQFVVTASVNSDSGGNATIPISPALTPGTGGTTTLYGAVQQAYQNVTASPANLTPITVTGTANTTYFQNLGFVKDAFGMVCVPLEVPGGTDFAAMEKFKGLAIRIARQWDINADVWPTRLDLLFGTSTYYPELACRLTE